MRRRGTAAGPRGQQPSADLTEDRPSWADRLPAAAELVSRYPGRTVAVFAIPVLLIKLVLAARTFGTGDMAHWNDFSEGVRLSGPVGIYGRTFLHSFYNHPPLIGYVLWFFNGLRDIGISDNFPIRALASGCDVGSAFVLLAMLRRRRPLLQATLGAVSLAVSPVLLLVSGFHGNTDPDFVFLALLGLYLLVDRRLPMVAGAVLALAVGIKIVPVVVLPALAVYAWKRARRTLVLFAAGFAVVFAITWAPALLTQFAPVKAHVLGYTGNGYSLWGVMQIGHWLGDPWWVGVLAGPGGLALVAVSALLPAAAVWYRPAAVLPAVAWSLLVFLAFATTFGVQYLVWPAAMAYLVGVRWATAYNVTAGVMLGFVYNRWSGGLPWDYAHPTVFTTAEKLGLLVPWIILLTLITKATMQILGAPVDRAALPGPYPTSNSQEPTMPR